MLYISGMMVVRRVLDVAFVVVLWNSAQLLKRDRCCDGIVVIEVRSDCCLLIAMHRETIQHSIVLVPMKIVVCGWHFQLWLRVYAGFSPPKVNILQAREQESLEHRRNCWPVSPPVQVSQYEKVELHWNVNVSVTKLFDLVAIQIKFDFVWRPIKHDSAGLCGAVFLSELTNLIKMSILNFSQNGVQIIFPISISGKPLFSRLLNRTGFYVRA